MDRKMKILFCMLAISAANTATACKNGGSVAVTNTGVLIVPDTNEILLPGMTVGNGNHAKCTMALDQFRQTIKLIDPSLNVLEVLEKVKSGSATLELYSCDLRDPKGIHFQVTGLRF